MNALLGTRHARAASRHLGPAGGPAIVLDGVGVLYGRGRPVLDGVTLSLESGEWLAVIGPNGAGKSSLLKAMAGLVDHSGAITINAEIETPGDGRPPPAAVVAYVAQRPVLPPGMTVAEYVLLGRSAHLGWLAAESRHDRQLVDDVLDRLALAPFAERSVTDLSGGEVQRVTLARALAQQAPILLLDEPTSALDIGHRIAVLELVDRLRLSGRLTIVSAMHDLGTAGRFADRLALLHEGSLVASGTPSEVLTEPILSRFYDTEVQVVTGADGGSVIVPLRYRPESERPQPERPEPSSSGSNR